MQLCTHIYHYFGYATAAYKSPCSIYVRGAWLTWRPARPSRPLSPQLHHARGAEPLPSGPPPSTCILSRRRTPSHRLLYFCNEFASHLYNPIWKVIGCEPYAPSSPSFQRWLQPRSRGQVPSGRRRSPALCMTFCFEECVLLRLCATKMCQWVVGKRGNGGKEGSRGALACLRRGDGTT